MAKVWTTEEMITEVRRIGAFSDVESDGKADYSWECELKDATGEVVATSINVYQLRKIGT